jgi:hypothetical protein
VNLRAGWCLSVALGMCVGFGSSARADCVSQGLRFQFEDNRTLASLLTVTDGGCTRSFTGGLNVQYESITIVQRARNLAIAPTSNGFGYTLRVLNNYRGKDSFGIRACGTSQTGKGCVTINYDVTIR